MASFQENIAILEVHNTRTTHLTQSMPSRSLSRIMLKTTVSCCQDAFQATVTTRLSSAETKSKSYGFYKTSYIENQAEFEGSSSFLDLWVKLVLWIVITKPATDLCWKCQDNNNKFCWFGHRMKR